jgi:hypothetical protein
MELNGSLWLPSFESEKHSEPIGWVVKERIGVGAYNPHALEKLRMMGEKLKGVLVVYPDGEKE